MSASRFWADATPQAVGTGLVVALVGYASSIAVVVQGLKAVGATTPEIASGLLAMAIGLGTVAVVASFATRDPISIAWTTPGMALLAASGAVAGGFPAAVGAFVLAGLLIVATGFFEPLGRLVAAIPKPIASAMLAGILLKLCLAPFLALKSVPVAAGAILVTWILVGRFAKAYAVPAAVVVALGFVFATAPPATGALADLVPSFTVVVPVFTLEAAISIALPLYVVTMASQNITGLAVLSTFGYRPKFGPLLMATGAASAVAAPFGSPTINLAAITAALCAGPDAGPDPKKRWVAAAVSGLGHVALGGLAAVTAGVVSASPPVLIEAVAGLALIGAFGGAMKGAVGDNPTPIPALATFLVTASGFSVFGIGAAFWGLVLGLALHVLEPRAGKS